MGWRINIRYIPRKLKDVRPDLKEIWDYERNLFLPKPLHFEDVNVYSSFQAYWKCFRCLNSKKALIAGKVKTVNARLCRRCEATIRKTDLINNLKTKHPEISSEWNYEKNGDLVPEELMPRSHVRAWWICSFCQKEWQAFVGNRTAPRACKMGCKSCNNRNRQKKVTTNDHGITNVCAEVTMDKHKIF